MRLCRLLGLVVAIQLMVVGAALGQGSYKAETIGAAPADVPASIQKVLDAQGVRVLGPSGATVCEVWLRKTIPTSSTPNTSSDVLYGGLGEGTFLGVVHFPNPAADFRGQALAAGYYTLRYVLIPQDGNHMGVNPYRDAFVLGPISSDLDPDKAMIFSDLVKLGRQTSGTAHPGFLVGAQVNGANFPSVVKDDSGNWNLQLKGHTANGDLPLAFTVVGKWQG